MPKRSTLRTLPAQIRRRLHARLVRADFGDLVSLSDWLTRQGFPIAKSALGAYARRHRAAIEAEHYARSVRHAPSKVPPAELQARLVCLDIASRHGAPATTIARAARLLRWAKGIDPDPPIR